VEPGKLHAHGKIVDSHRVFYSICLVGTYRLHVGLRSQAVPIPGSPFTLRVQPGPASSIATTLPTDVILPLVGVVSHASTPCPCSSHDQATMALLSQPTCTRACGARWASARSKDAGCC
jgi:hypothetical protein